MLELIIGLAGALLLHVYFRAVEARWPESYYGLSDFTSYQISLHFGKYATFRFLPVVIVALVVTVIAESHGGSGIAAAMVTAVVHALATAGRAAKNAYNQRRLFGRRLLLAAHVGVFALLFAAGYLGAWLGEQDQLAQLAPDPSDLRSDLWTAILAGIFGAYIARVTVRSQLEPEQLIRESKRRLDPDLLRLAAATAKDCDTDPYLAEAILLVENLQRPSWIRRIEMTLGRFLPIGSYGVMQVQSSVPISDSESIKKAITERLSGVTIPRTSRGDRDYEALRRYVRAYNGNERFVELVETVYDQLNPEAWNAWGERIS